MATSDMKMQNKKNPRMNKQWAEAMNETKEQQQQYSEYNSFDLFFEQKFFSNNNRNKFSIELGKQYLKCVWQENYLEHLLCNYRQHCKCSYNFNYRVDCTSKWLELVLLTL